MKESPRKRKRGWVWVGVALLCLTGPISISFIKSAVTEPEVVNILFIVPLLLFLGVPVGIIIYGVSYRRIAPTVETKQLEPDSLTPVTSKDERADKLCTHFLTMGIDAEKLRRHPLERAGVWGVLTRERGLAPLAKVAGKNISYVMVQKVSSEAGPRAGTHYLLDHLVPLRETPSRLCRARLGTKTKSFWSTEIVDIEWKGETLANTLNDDLTLKQRLLEEFQLNKPLTIEITPRLAYQ